jgi:hypothetical protein
MPSIIRSNEISSTLAINELAFTKKKKKKKKKTKTNKQTKQSYITQFRSMTKLFFLYMHRGQLHKQTPLVTHVYIIFFIRDAFLKPLRSTFISPSLVTNFPKSSVVGVHGNLYADHDKHSYESKTENPK